MFLFERKGLKSMKNFFASLSHRTKITLITCASFIVLTMLILIFLRLCPIQESSSANHVNDSLVVTTAVSEGTLDTAETTTAVATTKFNRKTTDAKRSTTRTETTVKSYQTQAVYDDNTYADDDGYNNDDNYEDYHPVVTTKKYYSNSTTKYTTAAPAVTQPPTPAATQAPAVTAAPAPSETIPVPDDTMYD